MLIYSYNYRQFHRRKCNIYENDFVILHVYVQYIAIETKIRALIFVQRLFENIDILRKFNFFHVVNFYVASYHNVFWSLAVSSL